MTLRAAVGEPRTVSVTFPAVATGSVAVKVASKRLGTTTDASATQVGSTATYTYTISGTHIAAVDLLEVTFTATITGVEHKRREWVQVAAAHYFTVDELRTQVALNSDKSFSDSALESVRTAVEDQIEANCDTSFVGRFVSETVNGDCEPFLRLSEPYVLDVISVKENEVDITDEVEVDGRYIWRGEGKTWEPGHRNITVQYERGYAEFPPEDLRRKSIEAARWTLMRETRTGTPQAALSITTDMGAMRLAVAGLRQPFGHPEVDAVVLSWAQRVGTVL